MVEIFIDEGGQFTKQSGWSLVSALVIPSSETGRLRRRLAFLTKSWPRVASGELKGGSLNGDHLAALVEQLFIRDALLYVVSIDMAREDPEKVSQHKTKQAEGITAHLTDQHHSSVVSQITTLRTTLERIPDQLYVQSLLMSVLVASTLEHTTLYFSQRRPRELGEFKWIIDAKDPRRVTTQEQWWKDIVAPWQESRSARHPLSRVRDPAFDYRFFDREYEFEKDMWFPDRPRERVVGYDVQKVVSEKISFTDSRSDILLQAVDILTSFTRRTLMGQITDRAVASTLGRLQITRVREGVHQPIEILSMTLPSGSGVSPVGKMLKAMSLAGRSMIHRPKRTLTSPKD